MNIADMVLCTTTIAASTETSILRSRAELTSFNEAAACTELEVLAAWSRDSCILAGDDSQLPPTIMSDNARWINTVRKCNHLTRQGKIPMIHRLREIGYPYWEQTEQICMAQGQFDIANTVIYANRLTYHDSAKLSYPRFELARKIKQWSQSLNSNCMAASEVSHMSAGPDDRALAFMISPTGSYSYKALRGPSNVNTQDVHLMLKYLDSTMATIPEIDLA